MKKIVMAIGLLAGIGLFSGPAMGNEASVELGKKLFEDPTLGGSRNEASCNSCHREGKGLGEAGAQPNLTEMINFCIERPLKGKKLLVDSAEMKALVLFIKSLDE